MSAAQQYVAVCKDASIHVVNPEIEGEGDNYMTKIYEPGTVLLAEVIRPVVLAEIKAGKIPHLVLTDSENEATQIASAAGAVEKRTGEIVVTDESVAEQLVAAGVGQDADEPAIISAQA